MSALTSLLVRDDVVSVKTVEDVIMRQVMTGGEVETILLEMSAVTEHQMSAYLAALCGALPATRDEVMKVSREVIRLAPRELCIKHEVVPLQVEEGSIVVASAGPPKKAVRAAFADAGFSKFSYRIAAKARISAAMAHHFEADIEPRMRRLAEKLRGKEPGVLPFVEPDPSLIEAQEESSEPDSAVESSAAPSEEPSADSSAETVASDPETAVQETAVQETAVQETAVQKTTEAAEDASDRDALDEPELTIGTATDSDIPPSLAADADAFDAFPRPIIEVTEARERLQRAASRDAILEAVFDYARGFFEFAAMLVIHGDFVEGHEAARRITKSGPDVDHSAAVRKVSLSLEGTALLGDVRRSGAPRLVNFQGGADEAAVDEAAVAKALGRGDAQASIILPLSIRGRVVLMLYGDRGHRPLGLPEVAPLLGFTPLVGPAFEQLILQRKKRSLPPAPQSQDAAAGEPTTNDSPADRSETSGSQDTEKREAHRRDTMPVATPDLSSVFGDEAESLGRTLSAPSEAPPPPSLGAVETGSAETGAPETSDTPAGRKRRSSVPYSLKPGSVDVVATKPNQRNRRRSTPAADARSDSDIPSQVHDVVKLPGDAPHAAELHTRPTVPNPGDPNIIVDMGRNVEKAVLELVELGPEELEQTMPTALDLGEAALPVLVRAFPGDLWFDREQSFSKLPRGRDVSAAARLLVAFGERAVPYVAALLESSDPDTRYYAALLAREFYHPDLIAPLGRRVHDEDEAVRDIAIAALRVLSRFSRAFDQMAEGLRAAAAVARQDVGYRLVGIRALGELRDGRSLELLARLLGDPLAEVRDAALDALRQISRQDFGMDFKRWTTWISENQHRHRIEWLIDALMHDDEASRTAAGDELKSLTQAYFGFHPKLPKRDRAVCQRKYREWWQQEGIAQHTRETTPG